jgi:hypothetical protein
MLTDWFTIEDDGPDGVTLRFDSNEVLVALDYDGTLSVQLRHASEQWEFYEKVRDQFEDWYQEGLAVKAEYEQRVRERGGDPAHLPGHTLVDRISDYSLDPLDPRHPSYAERLRELGDIRRKAEREG